MKSKTKITKFLSITMNSFFFIAAYIFVPVTIIVLSYPPTISSQGIAHRIFYFHVPIAWVALYAPLLCSIFAILYLYTRRDIYDIWSLANARIAYLFSLAVLVSGPLWASTEWGTYWNWKDARLISFFILFLSLNSYFLVRSFASNLEWAKSQAAIIGVLSALSAIMTWFAIRWIEPDTHPPPILDKMSPSIELSFWISVIAYHLLFWILLIIALRHEKIKRIKILRL